MSAIHEKKMVQQDIRVACKCDGCGKISSDPKEYDLWFNLSYGNNDYEPDYTYTDVCSIPCFIKLLNKGIHSIRGYDSGEVNEMNIHFAELLYEALLTTGQNNVQDHPMFKDISNENVKLKEGLKDINNQLSLVKNELTRANKELSILNKAKEELVKLGTK